MGCFESKPYEPIHTETADLETNTPIATSNSSPILEKNQVASKSTTLSVSNTAKDHENKILNVPRADLKVGQRERAELKIKNMRDKLQSKISLSEEVLQQDGRLALKMRREGNIASARILMQRRKLTQSRISHSEMMLNKIMDMLDTIDSANDNINFSQALEQGTAAINDIAKDLSVERVQNALSDNEEAIQYAQHINNVMAGDAESITDEELKEALDKIEEEVTPFPMTIPNPNPAITIPSVPTTIPELPEYIVEPQGSTKSMSEENVQRQPTPA